MKPVVVLESGPGCLAHDNKVLRLKGHFLDDGPLTPGGV